MPRTARVLVGAVAGVAVLGGGVALAGSQPTLNLSRSSAKVGDRVVASGARATTGAKCVAMRLTVGRPGAAPAVTRNGKVRPNGTFRFTFAVPRVTVKGRTVRALTVRVTCTDPAPLYGVTQTRARTLRVTG